MEILFAGLVVVLVLATISVTGALREIRNAAERTAVATESLLELERSRHPSNSQVAKRSTIVSSDATYPR